MSDIASSGCDDSDNEISISRKRRLTMLEDSSDSEDDSEVDDNSNSESDEDEDSEESGDEIDVIDDVSVDQCSICLMEFTDQVLGIPESCAHVFCSVCLLEWSKNVNTCPVDRKVYHSIIIRKRKDGPDIDKIKVEDRSQVEEEYWDTTACEICGIGDREDRMLLCDGCDRGYHLECLDPPLDSVPNDEWFCSECSVHRRSQPEQPTTQDSELYDDELLSISQEATRETVPTPSQATANHGSSSQRRARTVATSRRRRRRRRRPRTTDTRSSSAGKSTRRKSSKSSSKRKKTTKRSSSSTSKKNAITSTKKRRKVTKKRRKRTKTSKVLKDSSVKYESRGELSTARYVFPHEMEPTASFSIYGSDFDLEYLPVIEGRPMNNATTTKTERRKESSTVTTASTTDVLGSIFNNLETLCDNNVTIAPGGRLIRNIEAQTKPETVEETQNHDTTSIKSEGNSSIADTRRDPTRPQLSEVNRKRIMYFEKAKTGMKTFNTIFGGKLNNPERRDKKIPSRKHRDASSQNNILPSATFTGFKIPRRLDTSSKPETTPPPVSSPRMKNDRVEKNLPTESLTPNVGISHLLPNNVNTNKGGTMARKDNVPPWTEAHLTTERARISTKNEAQKPAYIGTYNDHRISPSTLHRGALKSSQIKECSTAEDTPNYYTLASTKYGDCLLKNDGDSTNSVTIAVGDSRSPSTKNEPLSQLCGTQMKYEAANRDSSLTNLSTIYCSVPCSSSTKNEPLSKLSGTEIKYEAANRDSSLTNLSTIYCSVPCSSSTKNEPLSKLSGTEIKYEAANRDSSLTNLSTIYGRDSRSPSTKKEPLSKLSGTAMKFEATNRDRSLGNISTICDGDSRSPSTKKEPLSKLSGTAMKFEATNRDSSLTNLSAVYDDVPTSLPSTKKKPTVSEKDSTGELRYRQLCSSVQKGKQQLVNRSNTDVAATTESGFKILPALRGALPTNAASSQRPIAVIHPRSAENPDRSTEAAVKRREGIERLQRDQEIQDEVKTALKVFYRHREINKEQYKCIFKRAVKKIRETNAVVESRGVMNLIRGYVKKIKGKLLL